MKRTLGMAFTAALVVALAVGGMAFGKKPSKPPDPDPAQYEIVAHSYESVLRPNCAYRYRLHLFTADGDTRELVKRCDCGTDSPSWSPDLSRIVFHQYWWPIHTPSRCPSPEGITTVDTGVGSDFILVSEGAQPAWSPDGTQIAYQGQSDIMMIPVDSQGQPVGPEVNITNTPGIDERYPTWSPLNDRLAYVRFEDVMLPHEIVIRELASGQETSYDGPYANGWIRKIAWAKTGDRLAVSTGIIENNDWGPAELWLGDLTGSGITWTQLEIDGLGPRGLSWSPDDTRLVFTSEVDRDLYVVGSDGSNLTLLAGDGRRDPDFMTCDWSR